MSVKGMAAMTSKQASAGAVGPGSWHALQVAQFSHDERFHREISRLSVQDRLKHMTLHFAKYAGELLSDESKRDPREVLVDTFIIAISTANILGLDLEKFDLEDPVEGSLPFATRLSVATGRLAAACEKLDHLEAFPFRETIADGVIVIIRSSKAEAELRQLDIFSAVNKRLDIVKHKSLFYDELSGRP
jgi:hypothetical protein